MAAKAIKSDPNNMGAFLILAAANAELNRPQAARQAAAEVRRISPDFNLEKYAAMQPYKEPAMLEQIIDRLKMAGLT